MPMKFPLYHVRARFPVFLTAMLLALMLAACATGPATQDTSQEQPADWPPAPKSEPGQAVYRVDRDASEIRLRVEPAGTMARFGHVHIIGGQVLDGTILVGPGRSDARADLSIDIAALEVDREQWRRDEGLDPLDPDAIEGTRRNLLGERVLDAAQWPSIDIRLVGASGPAWLPSVTARIRLRGEVREIVAPVAVEISGTRLVASGRFEISQQAFGMEPFSAAGGALRVADAVTIRFRIVAVASGDDVAMMRDGSTL